jgi:hypothetical protein
MDLGRRLEGVEDLGVVGFRRLPVDDVVPRGVRRHLIMQQVRDDVANGPFGGRRGVELKRENRGVSLSLLATVGEADMVGMATLAQIEADRTVDALLAAVLRLDDRRIDDRPLEQEFQAVALKDLVAGLDLLVLVVDLDSRRPGAMIGRRDNDADPDACRLVVPSESFP